jgi:hypothetical protein
MCAGAVSMVSIHPHSRCKFKCPGVCCMLYAVSVRVSVPPRRSCARRAVIMRVSAVEIAQSLSYPCSMMPCKQSMHPLHKLGNANTVAQTTMNTTRPLSKILLPMEPLATFI